MSKEKTQSMRMTELQDSLVYYEENLIGSGILTDLKRK